jgi:hypothetical protein
MTSLHAQEPAARRRLPGALLRQRSIRIAAVVVLLGAVAGAALATTASAARTGTVRGVVVLGPMIPVDPGSPIVWIPEKTAVSVVKSGSPVLMVTPSDANGRYALRLTPGRYRLTARWPGTTVVSHVVTLTVRAGGSYEVRLWLDNGVRFPANATAKAVAGPSGRHLRYDQGIVGVTTLGPLAPVGRPRQANDKRYAATLLVWHDNGAPAATVQSSAKDGFIVALPVGRYIVEPRGSRPALYPRAAPFSVTVKRNSWQTMTVVYDTGIR